MSQAVNTDISIYLIYYFMHFLEKRKDMVKHLMESGVLFDAL